MKSLKLIGLALCASLALSTTTFAQDITVAVAGPMTDSESAFGIQMRNGIKAYFDHVNEQGGVHGRNVTVFFEDGRLTRVDGDLVAAGATQ